MIDPDDFEKVFCELNTEIAELTNLWETTRDENIKLLKALKVAAREFDRLADLQSAGDYATGELTVPIENPCTYITHLDKGDVDAVELAESIWKNVHANPLFYQMVLDAEYVRMNGN